MPSVRTTLLPWLLSSLSLALAPIPDTPAAHAAAQAPPTELRWSVAIAAHPAVSPVIAGERVFVALDTGVVAAHRLADGTEEWRSEIKAEQPLAVDGGRLVIASGEAIHALAVDSARVLWRAPSGTLTAPPLAQDGWIVAAASGTLAAFRSADGSKVWAREAGPQRVRPTIEGNNLYVPLDDGRLLALDLRTGATRWERRFPVTSHIGSGSTAVSEVLAYPDRVFAGASDGRFYCLRAEDGSLDWRFRVGAILRGGPVGAGGRIFIATMDNVVRAFDRQSGALLWHPTLPFRPAGPVMLGGLVMVPGTASEVRSFDTAGTPAGQIKLEESLVVPPAFAASSGGAVMAAVSGSLNGEWKLLLMEEARGVPLVPLTVMPGVTVSVDLPAPQS